MKKRKTLELGALAKEFELHNRSEGRSPRTVQWYNDVLDLFEGWLESEGLGTSLADLGPNEVRRFILHLQERPGLRGPASSHTVNNRVRALRSFFNWLYSEGYTEEHRLARVRPPKAQRKVIDILTDDEICQIFQALDPHSPSGARGTAIISLMLDTGLRLSEVVHLKYRDVHLEDGYLKVLGKGDKERLVAFGASCRRSLIHYAFHHRTEPDDEEVREFFLCLEGYPLSSDGLRSLTERLSRQAGVLRLHPHLLRHTYATRFLLNGGDALLLKQNLGHTTLTMVEKYIHLANQLAAVASQKFSPLDSLEYPVLRKGRRRGNRRGSPGPHNGRSEALPPDGARRGGSRAVEGPRRSPSRSGEGAVRRGPGAARAPRQEATR